MYWLANSSTVLAPEHGGRVSTPTPIRTTSCASMFTDLFRIVSDHGLAIPPRSPQCSALSGQFRNARDPHGVTDRSAEEG